MKKLLLLCAFLSLNIYAAPSVMCVLDFDGIEKESNILGIERTELMNMIAQWAQENKQLVVFPKHTLAYSAPETDATQEFLAWLKNNA